MCVCVCAREMSEKNSSSKQSVSTATASSTGVPPTTGVGDPRVFNINVGILGHVDSGKTSLVKALSTTLSTAALDKHPQSQQRGITLDLGFSAFILPLPKRFEDNPSLAEKYDYLQFTLVDCPGHASLIRTIIGGAQIIDMIVLVIDVTKGIQTQTAECIVIGEITSDAILIALNKIDLLPEEQREEKIEKMTRRIRKTLMNSKFANSEIVPVSAFIGGEKTAAISGGTPTTSSNSLGMTELVERITSTVRISERDSSQPFYFAVDHCFAVKGHGTVLTGTVLSGAIAVNQVVEIPILQTEKKVKSMQMFRKNVKSARQGDRVGICVTNLDPTAIERGFLAAPHSVPLVSAVICLVRKVRFCKLPCKSGSKIHVSLCHHTVLATVTFFGADALQHYSQHASNPSVHDSGGSSSSQERETHLSGLLTAYQQSFPPLAYSPHTHYPFQEEIVGSETCAFGHEPLQWALLQFPHPLYVPDHALMIGSRLDAEVQEHLCRLAFYGPVRYSFVSNSTATNTNTTFNAMGGSGTTTAAAADNASSMAPATGLSAMEGSISESPMQQLVCQTPVPCPRVPDRFLAEHIHIYHLKYKECEIWRIVDQRRLVRPVSSTVTITSTTPRTVSSKQKGERGEHEDEVHVFEVIVWKLVKEHASLIPFVGLKLCLPPHGDASDGNVGTIVGLYDTDKLRVQFASRYGARGVRVGMKMSFPYKKYVSFVPSSVISTSHHHNHIHNNGVMSVPQRHMVQTEDLFTHGRHEKEDASAAAASLVWEVVHDTSSSMLSSNASMSDHASKASKNNKKMKKKEKTKQSVAEGEPSAGASITESTGKMSVDPEIVPPPEHSIQTDTLRIPSNHNGNYTNHSNSSSSSSNCNTAGVSDVSRGTTESESRTCVKTGRERVGQIESLKPSTEGGYWEAIVVGAFRMEENLKRLVNDQLIVSVSVLTRRGQVPGEVLGPFGKLGKCKLRIPAQDNEASVAQVHDWVTIELASE